ncbi:hypothetical protein J2X61_001206 [Bacillus sp. 3255]|nr:hypothetical protein [Bacillus sp. 3255]
MPHQRFQSANIKPRYSKGQISVFGINSVYPRTPWVTSGWSAALTVYVFCIWDSYRCAVEIKKIIFCLKSKMRLSHHQILAFSTLSPLTRKSLGGNALVRFLTWLRAIIWRQYSCWHICFGLVDSDLL